MISIPALVLTAGWIVLVAVILVLFGRTAGGAWSIAGGVVRGVRSWASQRPEPPSVATAPRAAPSPAAELEDL